MDKIQKIQGDSHGQRWTTWLLWKEGVKLSDNHRRLSAVRGEKAPARNTAFNWVRIFKSVKKTGQVAAREWYRNIPEELFCEDIRKLPRRWERFITKRGI
jgi:hypothetical protein